MSAERTEKCGANGGQGLGAGHVCICVGEKGHAPYYGKGHGCSCGAIWADPQVKAGPVLSERDEIAMVLFAVENYDSDDIEHDWQMLATHAPRHLAHYFKMADALIVAGYERNPAATGAKEQVWDEAVEAAAAQLERIVHYAWNGNRRKPNNYRAAAADVRTTPNPYRTE